MSFKSPCYVNGIFCTNCGHFVCKGHIREIDDNSEPLWFHVCRICNAKIPVDVDVANLYEDEFLEQAKNNSRK